MDTNNNKDKCPVYNAHMHLINFAFIPDNYYQVLFDLTKYIPGAKVSEALVKTGLVRRVALLVGVWQRIKFRFFRGDGRFRRVDKMLKLFKEYMNDVTDDYVRQMDGTDIDVAVPMMMDLGPANPSQRPEVPFEYQIAIIHEQMMRHPGRFLPFVFFDPRRKGAMRLVKKAVMEMGFAGVKMYPPLGYHTVPESVVNDKDTCKALHEFYDWCQKEKVPLTAHCSQGGAYSGVVHFGPALQNYLCRPYNWKEVLERWPKLRINLAHFGGAFTRPKPGQKEFMDRAVRWRDTIIDLMRRFPCVYTDVSYHDKALWPDTKAAYFAELKEYLNDPDLGDRILFGTDWPMTAHTWTEAEFVAPFADGKNLSPDEFKKLSCHNPRRFLSPSLARIKEKGIKGRWEKLQSEIDLADTGQDCIQIWTGRGNDIPEPSDAGDKHC